MIPVNENLIMDRFRPTDAESLAGHANNPRIARFLRNRFPSPYTLADAREFIAVAEQVPEGMLLGIRYRGEVIGAVGLEPGTDIHRRSAELGYWLAEPYWGRGMVTACVRRYVDFQFERSDLLRIYAEPFADNPASIRVLEKCGFSREGLLRQHAVKDGRVKDVLLYARIRPLD